MERCDVEGCEEEADKISRLSPEGYLVSSGKKAYSSALEIRHIHSEKPTKDFDIVLVITMN